MGSHSARLATLERSALRGTEVALLVLAIGLRFLHLDADIPLLQRADDLGDEGYWLVPARDLLRFGAVDAGSNFHQGLAGAPLSVATYTVLGWLCGGLDLGLARSPSAFYSALTLVLGLVYFDHFKRMPLAAVVFLGLYGLLPVTLFYSRIAHLEQHVLFYLVLAFVVLERARGSVGIAAAGFLAALAVAVKMVALLVLPAFVLFLVLRDRARARIVPFAAGAALPLAAFTFHLRHDAERFAPTFAALRAYTSTGFFVDAFSIQYFWLHPLVRPALVWIALAIVMLVVVRPGDGARLWILSWIATVIAGLSYLKYGSWARHMLLFFPLLLLAALGAAELRARLASPRARAALSAACVCMLAATALVSTWRVGHSVFLAPRYTYRDAGLRVAAVTDASDRVVGVHNFALALAGEYRPRMMLNARQWRGIDPPPRARPTAVLVAEVFDGEPVAGRRDGWRRVFPRADQFPYAARLATFAYLDHRFVVEIHRVFATRREYERFAALRQERPLPYDGLLYSRYANDLEMGCLVKGALVADLRDHGDPLGAGDRFDVHAWLRAADGRVGELRSRFAAYGDRERLLFGAYHGGVDLVARLVERAGRADPRWDADLLPLLAPSDSVVASDAGGADSSAPPRETGVALARYVDDAWRSWKACHRFLE
jgi:hypothetical protein